MAHWEKGQGWLETQQQSWSRKVQESNLFLHQVALLRVFCHSIRMKPELMIIITTSQLTEEETLIK